MSLLAGSLRPQSSPLNRRSSKELYEIGDPLEKSREWRVFDLIFLATITLGLLIVLFRDTILPAKFFYDGQLIQSAASGRATYLLNESYAAVGDLYRALGLADHQTVASVSGYVAALLVLQVVRRRNSSPPSPATIFLFVISTILSAVYLGYYSKDVVVLGISFLVIALPEGLVFEALLVGAMVFYASEFRSYWYLVAVLYIAARFVLPRIRTLRAWLLAIAIAAFAVTCAVMIVQGVPVDYYRQLVNGGRVGSADASSMIKSYVHAGGILGGLGNELISIVFLAFPVPLMLLGGAYYLVLGVIIAGVWSIFIRSCYVRLAVRKGLSELTRPVCVVLAFVVVQGLFEPDYGSAVRHLTPLLPLFVAVSWSARRGSTLEPE